MDVFVSSGLHLQLMRIHHDGAHFVAVNMVIHFSFETLVLVPVQTSTASGTGGWFFCWFQISYTTCRSYEMLMTWLWEAIEQLDACFGMYPSSRPPYMTNPGGCHVFPDNVLVFSGRSTNLTCACYCLLSR